MRFRLQNLRLAPMAFVLATLSWPVAHAAEPPVAGADPRPVTVSGAVPDEATKAVVLARLRELYADRPVVDRMTVDPAVVAPDKWPQDVVTMLDPALRQVHHGELQIDGRMVGIQGDVGDAVQRQDVQASLAALRPDFIVRDRLRIREQNVLQATLAGRIVEFETGSSTLTPKGAGILDEIMAVWPQVGNRQVVVVGHTDAVGSRRSNIALSLARAQAVRTYLMQHGIDVSRVDAKGDGPDQPVADNATEAGRARNRRIEFQAL